MKIPTLPEIKEEERTPQVEVLLLLLEQAIEIIQKQAEDIGHLKDEIAVLKGEKKRPVFKPSKLDEEAEKEVAPKDGEEQSEGKNKRPGSEKKHKTKALAIHRTEVIHPAGIPQGSRFKGYRDFIVQDIKIEPCNTCYRLACWRTPDGRVLAGQLPSGLDGRHFGDTLTSYILYQHHHCHVTQPLLREQLQEWGIDISTGQINAILCDDKGRFHQEKDALLSAGLASSSYITVDDTGTRHKGKNAYVLHIGNAHFAWFKSTFSKSRINFLSQLRAGRTDYWITPSARAHMVKQGLPKEQIERVCNHPNTSFAQDAAWQGHLDSLNMMEQRHRQIATEAALLGSLEHHGVAQELAIVSDDAGQFNVLKHGLCWVHAERLIHKLLPLNDFHREDLDRVRSQIWALYADLKAYKRAPDAAQKKLLSTRFDVIFTQKTRYATLNSLLRRLHQNKSELLLVLDRPDIPLHTNGSETDIRDHVKKQKVSGGTRSDLGQQCRDTFSSLKKTCRKLGISFWEYLTDRISCSGQIPLLPNLIQQRFTTGTG